MPGRIGKGHLRTIENYINEVVVGHYSYEDRIHRLRDFAPGYRRVLAMFYSDADIENGGFDQYYYNGFGCMAMSAIEGYARLDAIRMVAILKSSLYVCFRSHPEYVTGTDFGDVVREEIEAIEPIGITFSELDKVYYEEKKHLPGIADVGWPYIDGVIDFYFENFPEDFGRGEQ